MEKYYVLLDGVKYELPSASLYIDRFSYIDGDTLYIPNNVDIETRYEEVKKLYFFVSGTICSFDEDEFYPVDLLEEKADIRKRINSVSSLEKFFYKKGEIDKSIKVMLDLTKVMLVHNEKLMNSDIEETKVL